MVATSGRVTGTTAGVESRPVASYRTNLVTVLLSTWVVVGLMLDAWAHNNVPKLETFFTPWHAVFYSGFVATAAWIAWTSRHAVRAGWRGLWTLPVGYAAAPVAVVGFGVAAVGDLTWHLVFGIEQSVNILFSPTHLGLMVAMLLIATAPLRSAWADRSLPAEPGLRRLLPAVLSMALAMVGVLLFVQYANALTFDSRGVVLGLSGFDEFFTDRLVAAMAVTNLVLIVPVLTLARRWALPFGAVTILYAGVAGLSAAVAGFGNLNLVGALLAGGVFVDVLARWLRPTPERLWRFRAFAAFAPLVTWTIFIVTGYLTAPPLAPPPGVSRPEAVVELYTGAPLVQALVGLLIAIVLVPAVWPAQESSPANPGVPVAGGQ